MVANITTQDDLIPSPGTVRRNIHPILNHADASRGNEDLVSLASIDDFGIAGHELYVRLSCRRTHRLNHPAQVVNRQTFFEDESCGQIERSGAAHRQIIHRSMHRQPPDVAAGKKDWCDDKGVSGKGQARRADRDHCLVV